MTATTAGGTTKTHDRSTVEGALSWLRLVGSKLARKVGRRLGKILHGYATAPNELWRWLTATDLRARAKVEEDNTKAGVLHVRADETVRDHRQALVNVLRVIICIGGGGWWPVSLLSLLMVGAAWWRNKNVSDKDAHEVRRAQSGVPWAVAGFVVSLSLGIADYLLGRWPATADLGGVPATSPTWQSGMWLLIEVAVGLVILTLWSWDGTVANELAPVEDVDSVEPNADSGAAIALCLAMALWGEKPGRALLDPGSPDRHKIRTVGGDLAWDARRVWKSITFQLTGKTIEDVRRVETAIAGYLQVPAEYLIIDSGSNQAQVVLHMAESDPWAKTASPWPGLHAPVQDVWEPTEVGLDLLGGTPFTLAVAQSSMLVGASTGAGKTAFLRMLSLVISGDPRAQLDIWNLKPRGDSALKMFAPVCETYRTGSEDEDVAAFAAFLRSAKADLKRRNEVLGGIPYDAAEDVKITRELAHRTDIDLRPRFIVVDEVQEATEDPEHGADVIRDLKYLAKQGRSGGVKLILATQKPDADAIPSAIRSVLPTRVALRCEDWTTSDMILGSSRFRASDMPPVGGAAIIKLAGDGGAVMGLSRLRLHYVNAAAAAAAVDRIVAMRRASGTMPAEPVKPTVPRVLGEMHRLLSDPSRQGRMRSVELAAAMVAYGILEVTDADRAGHEKPEEQVRQEKLADAVRPFGVRTRPDSADGNKAAYWLTREHRDYGDVGVAAAVRRAEGGVLVPGFADGQHGLRAGDRPGLPSGRRLRAV